MLTYAAVSSNLGKLQIQSPTARRNCHPERSEGSLAILPSWARKNPEMFESLASCFAFRCSASLLMNTAGRCEWWNIGLWPVCPAEMFSAASQSAGYKPAGRTDWKSMFRLRGLTAASTRCSSSTGQCRAENFLLRLLHLASLSSRLIVKPVQM